MQIMHEKILSGNFKWKYPEVKSFFNASDDLINSMLAVMGENFGCSCSYVYERKDKNRYINTYIWNKKDDEFGKSKRREGRSFISFIEENCSKFENGMPVLIEEEGLKQYKNLQADGIKSLILTPICREECIVGFIGADNPPLAMCNSLIPFMKSFSDILSLVKEYSDSMNYLEFMSFYDQMTGAFNRNAFEQIAIDTEALRSCGIIFCDVSELKSINDNEGHEKGDQLIRRWYYILKRIFHSSSIYRIGGDEFIVICRNMKKSVFKAKLSELKDFIRKEKNHLAIGACWEKGKKINMLQQTKTAESLMYQDKEKYYTDYGKRRRRLA